MHRFLIKQFRFLHLIESFQKEPSLHILVQAKFLQLKKRTFYFYYSLQNRKVAIKEANDRSKKNAWEVSRFFLSDYSAGLRQFHRDGRRGQNA